MGTGRVIINKKLGLKGASTAELDELNYLLEFSFDRIGALDFQRSPTEYIPRESNGEGRIGKRCRMSGRICRDDQGQSSEPRPLVHPTMARRYRSEFTALIKALHNGEESEAREHVRGLIEKIMMPKLGKEDLTIDLYGDLAGILRIASETKTMKAKDQKIKRPEVMAINDNHNFEPFIQLVAGAGSHLDPVIHKMVAGGRNHLEYFDGLVARHSNYVVLLYSTVGLSEQRVDTRGGARIK